jgi:5-methylcytosine-specific restriction endonuclease McrA
MRARASAENARARMRACSRALAPAVDHAMKYFQVSRLADHVLLHDLAELVARDRSNLAEMLAHLAEVDARRLYRPAAYPSMYQYCVGELHMSEDTAFKRIQAARAAREYPGIYPMIQDGRLTLTAVVLLAPHLSRANAEGLLAAGAFKTKDGISLLLAEHFPQPDLATRIQPVVPASCACQLVPEPVGMTTPEHVLATAAAAPAQLAPVAQVAQVAPRAKLTPLAPQRFALQVTIGQATHDKLRRAKELLAHTVPSGDVAEVLDRALDALITQLERRRLAATDRPRARRSAANGRRIPAEVIREVTRRDGGQCTFVSKTGRRCEERGHMEYDHVRPVARGGRSTVDNLRLRCRAHNQHEADRVFGKGFMDKKRLATPAPRSPSQVPPPIGT